MRKYTFATLYSGIQLEETIRETVAVLEQTQLKMLYLDFFFSQDHIEQCSKFSVSRPNSCGVSIPKEIVRLSIWLFCERPCVSLLLKVSGLQCEVIVEIVLICDRLDDASIWPGLIRKNCRLLFIR